MRQTALSIIQSVVRRANEPLPSDLTGTTDLDDSTDPAVLQLKELLYAVLEELRQVGTWTEQKRKHEFDTVASTTQYMLPADYYCPLPNTHWNESETQRLIGPVSDEEFAYYLESGHTPSRNYVYRLFNWDVNRTSTLGQFEITPTPSSAQTLYFEYATRHLFLPANYALATAYTAGDLVNVSGEIYQCATDITESDTVPTGKTTGIGDDDGTWDWYNTPFETINEDTDLVLYDADLVKLGLRAKWYEEKGGSFELPAAEFESKIEAAKARYKGTRKATFLKGGARWNRWHPYRNWDLTE